MIKFACHCLYDSLDSTNRDIKDSLPNAYKQYKKDMEILDKIMSKLEVIND